LIDSLEATGDKLPTYKNKTTRLVMCEKRADLPEGIFSCTTVRIDTIILTTSTSLISQLYKANTNLTSGVPVVISDIRRGVNQMCAVRGIYAL
jgi:hypothetical protein